MFLQKNAQKVLFMCYYLPENVFATHLLSRLFAACFSHICSLFFLLVEFESVAQTYFCEPHLRLFGNQSAKKSILFWKAWDQSLRQAHLMRDGSLLNRIGEHWESACNRRQNLLELRKKIHHINDESAWICLEFRSFPHSCSCIIVNEHSSSYHREESYQI